MPLANRPMPYWPSDGEIRSGFAPICSDTVSVLTQTVAASAKRLRNFARCLYTRPLHGPKPYEFIWFGGLHGPKSYEFIGFGGLHRRGEGSQNRRETASKSTPGPLSRDLQNVWVFRFLTRAPGPREASERSPWAIRGPSQGSPGASRRPPEPKTNQSKKHRNLKELTEQWSVYPRPGYTRPGQTLGGLKFIISLFIFLRSVPKTQSAHDWDLELISGADYWC